MKSQMNAVRVHELGSPAVLRYEETATPQPADDEVRVRIHAAGVNPAECGFREGISIDVPLIPEFITQYSKYLLVRFGPLSLDFPWIPGWDIAGVIDEVGTDVSEFAPGDGVYGMTPLPGDGGAYAEAVTVPPAQLRPKPVSLSFEEAAGVPMAGGTAWRSMRLTDLQADQRILIHAAAGGVGHFAVQFAKHRGAHVIGTASGSNEAYLRDLGVDEFVNYREERFEEVIEPVDVVIDLIGDDTFDRSLDVLKRGGVIDNFPLDASRKQKRAADKRDIRVIQADSGDPAWLEDITELIDDGTVTPTLDTVFPLADARAAQELSEEGHARGKIILKVREGVGN